MADDVFKFTLEEIPSAGPGAWLLRPRGEIAYSEAPIFRSTIKSVFDKGPRKFVVDMSGIDYMNTPGLAALVEALQTARRNQIKFILFGLNERVMAIFEIARLNRVFDIKPDEASAIAG
ncbi:MAG: STAS domain-containing protein [Planctomycetota bacterium]|nr:STAS domain-containing protein [Planctomycetota bacterium]